MIKSTRMNAFTPLISKYSLLDYPFCLHIDQGLNDCALHRIVMSSSCSPYSPNGLYVNLSTFGGVGKDFLEFDSKRTNAKLYVHLKYTKVSEREKAFSSKTSISS